MGRIGKFEGCGRRARMLCHRERTWVCNGCEAFHLNCNSLFVHDVSYSCGDIMDYSTKAKGRCHEHGRTFCYKCKPGKTASRHPKLRLFSPRKKKERKEEGLPEVTFADE